MEGVDRAVLGHVIALGDGRDGRAVGVHLHQTVDAVGNDLKGFAVGGEVGVQGHDVGAQHDAQVHVAVGERGRDGKGAQHSQDQQQGYEFFHVWFLPFV